LKGEITGISPDCSFCRKYPVSRCGVFEAWPRLMAFPVDYQWCICGEILEKGTGEVETKYGPLAYNLKGRRLYIETEMAQGIDCELCVSAIDARGLELFTCIRVNKSGIEVECKKCDPSNPKVRVEMMAIAEHLNNWRPLLTEENINLVGKEMKVNDVKE
jgi:hypothetical protein